MIPEMMGMGRKIPTIQELWKKEKTKYRHWVIVLAIGLIVISALTWTSFVLNIIDRKDITENIKSTLKDGDDFQKDKLAKEIFIRNNIVFASIISIFTLTGIIWYFTSLMNVYKTKNFANLSRWPILIIGVGTVVSFVQLFLFLISKNERESIFATKGSIFTFSTRVIYILIYFAASSPISKVRRTFLISEQWEKLMKDKTFQKINEQISDGLKGGKMPHDAFGPVLSPDDKLISSNNSQNLQKNKKTDSIKEKENEKLQKLKNLSIEKLQEIARRLSISGYKLMNKDELIKSIMRIYT